MHEKIIELSRYKKLPKIVCLCGSTRFHKEFVDQKYKETMKGNIVLSVGFFAHSGEAHGEHIGISADEKLALDELHKRKIDLADEILVINVGGYIGDSTRSEIEYAKKHQKGVRYMLPPKDDVGGAEPRRRSKMHEKVKVIVEVKNGCVASVLAGVRLDVIVVDHDAISQGGAEPKDLVFRDGVNAADFMEALSTRDWS